MTDGTEPFDGPTAAAALAYALQRTARRHAVLGQRRVARLAPQAPPPTQGRPPDPHVPQNETIRPQAPPRRTAEPARPAPARPARQSAPAPTRPAPRAPEPPGSGSTGSPTRTPAEIAAGVDSLDELRGCVADCRACGLAESRTQTVFADGLGTRRILFVGEAPGADEDRVGTPFVGRAGQLLTDIITKGMKLGRDDVYIANVLKCRPPGNRDPLPSETELCTGWLDRQIELVDPLVIIPLGRHAACHVLGVDAPLGRLRARVHDRNGRKVVPTYHPAYLLRSPQEKRKTWEDIQLAMREAGL